MGAVSIKNKGVTLTPESGECYTSLVPTTDASFLLEIGYYDEKSWHSLPPDD